MNHLRPIRFSLFTGLLFVGDYLLSAGSLALAGLGSPGPTLGTLLEAAAVMFGIGCFIGAVAALIINRPSQVDRIRPETAAPITRTFPRQPLA